MIEKIENNYPPIESMGDSNTDHITKVFNSRAVFSDGTSEYRSPAEPMPGDVVTIRLRTARENASAVVLVTNKTRIPMGVASSDSFFDYYECRFQVETENVEYYFLIWCDEKYYYYNQCGIADELRPDYNFFIMPGFATPDWAKGAVIYQIFADRFYNGDPSNDVLSHEYAYIGAHSVRVENWSKYPDKMGVREFYGGDLQGILKKLDYLQDLGVEVIYLNPIFVSPSNHKYDIQDYDYIDPHFGVISNDGGALLSPEDNDNSHAERYIRRVTDKRNLEASNRFFAELIKEIHKRGMKIILDGVFNHCGSFNKWLDRQKIYEKSAEYSKGAYVDSASPYRSFFHFTSENWPYNGDYDGWWGHDTLPKMNYEESPLLFEYIMYIGQKWVSEPYNVDGWRLDVAADLGRSEGYNHNFWKAFRRIVKDANPNAIIIAEHYGDCKSWLQGKEWDTIMNYDAFMEPLTWFLTGMEKHSDERRDDLYNNAEAFYGAMLYHMARMNCQSLQTSMNELSNHDHSRFLTRTNRRVGRTEKLGPEAANANVNTAVMREAVVIQMTWPGAPTVYYGDEVGVCGWTDPDNRRTFPWGREDKALLRFHKEMIYLHKSYDALRTGSIKFLAGREGILAYGRFKKDEKLVIAVNNNRNEEIVDIPVWEIGFKDTEFLVRLAYTDEGGYGFDTATYKPEHGVVKLNMKPFSAVVLKNLPSYLR